MKYCMVACVNILSKFSVKFLGKSTSTFKWPVMREKTPIRPPTPTDFTGRVC